MQVPSLAMSIFTHKQPIYTIRSFYIYTFYSL